MDSFGGVHYSGSKQSRLLDLIREEHLPAISVSKSKNVLLVGYFKLTTVKLICAFRKTVTSACGRCLGRKHLYTFTTHQAKQVSSLRSWRDKRVNYVLFWRRSLEKSGYSSQFSIEASSPRVASPPPKKYPGQKNTASYAG